MRNLRLYPRGYLGARLTGKIERIAQPQATEVQAVQNTFRIYQSGGPDRVAPNDLIEVLYKKLIGGSPESLKFDFREQVIIAALSAFGSKDFSVWVSAQAKSPYFGTTHSEFIDDTLRFIRTGERLVSLTTWEAIIKDDDDGEIRNELSEEAKEFFGISTFGNNRTSQNTNVIDVIHSWISKPNGISDLLCTLHVLFGDI